MKAVIDHTQLAAACAYAARALPARPPVPTLAAFHLHAQDDALEVSGFDYEASARATAVARVTEPGTLAVPGRLLADIAGRLRGEIHLSSDAHQLTVEAGAARFTLHTLPLEEYPALPRPPATAGTLPGDLLATAVAQVATAAARDETLPVLTGIQLAATAEGLTLAATDRYRIAVRTIPWAPTDPGRASRALIPAKTLVDLAKDLTGGDVALALPDGTGVIGLTAPGRTGTARALDGELPDHRPFFAAEHATEVTVDAAALATAVERVALVAERNTPVRLTVQAGHIAIEAGATDDALARDRVDADVDGTPMAIAFNPGFLLDGLKALGADTLRLGLRTPTKPAALRTATGGAHDPAYLLMPVRLSA
ncbi:DNA polymerase III subunit beta [Streptomyces megasporus]|uniref:DNA polymerase III subunit beta n=1 Tax=Streptomyces megasporus TaxID=44060 RepID=UPI0004E286D2|nr:DNA polymerase III subunit beta [Streptomyces megasporus]